MAEPVFYLRTQFGKGLGESLRNENRVVAETKFSPGIGGYGALHFSLKTVNFSLPEQCEYRPESGAAVGGMAQIFQQESHVGRCIAARAGVMCRIYARLAVQGMYLQTRVIGQTADTGFFKNEAGLFKGVALQRTLVFRKLDPRQDFCEGDEFYRIGQNSPDLLQFVGIVGGKTNPGFHPAKFSEMTETANSPDGNLPKCHEVCTGLILASLRMVKIAELRTEMNTNENEPHNSAQQAENQILKEEMQENRNEEAGSEEAGLPEAAGPVVSELDKAIAESAEWKDKYLRLYAEFDNFRQRTSREKLALVGTATEGLMTELLPVVDDFERSLKAMETAHDVESLREGVDLVYQKMMKILARKGLRAMEAIGQPFDAELHEAITQIPAPEAEQKGKVLDEIEKGYSLNDKTIRFAKVVIGA